MTSPQRITARDNPLLKDLRKLSQDGSAYRKLVGAEPGRHCYEKAHTE